MSMPELRQGQKDDGGESQEQSDRAHRIEFLAKDENANDDGRCQAQHRPHDADDRELVFFVDRWKPGDRPERIDDKGRDQERGPVGISKFFRQ